MVRIFLYFIFLLFTAQGIIAQKQDKKLSVEIGELISKARKQNELSSAIKFVGQAISLSQQSDNDSLIIATYYNKPLMAAILGDFDKSLSYLHEFDSVLAIHYHPYYDFRRYTLYAYAYSMKNNYDMGLTYNLKSIEMAKKTNNNELLADAYNNIGKEYMNLDEKENSYKYLKLADSIYTKINGHGTYVLYNNLSQVAHSFEEAKAYSQKAYQLSDTTNLQDLALFYLIRADAFQTQEHYKESLIAGRKAYNLADNIDNKMLQNSALIYMGKNYYFLNKLDSAIAYLEKGLEYNKEMLSNKMEIARMLSKAYEKKSNYKQAFQYHKVFAQYYDSIKYDEAKTKYAEFDVKYETAKKDKEIAIQKLEIINKNKSRDRIIFGSLLALMLVIGFFQWYLSKHRKKKQLAEQELQKEQELNAMRKRFLENIAHEIRTPITLINGHLELATENISDTTNVQKHIKTALSNSQKVLSNANEILDLLKLENKGLPVVTTEFLPDSFFKRIFFSFSSLAELKKTELKYVSDLKPDVTIKSDKDSIEKILNNLISNAIKFSPSGSEIIFEASLQVNQLTVKVTDFGPGISKDEQKKIFNRFYQSSETSNVGGMGIGLSLANELAKSLGGKISVESESGKGATFIFSMTVEIRQGKVKPGKQVSNNKNKTSKPVLINPNDKTKILIVEDNPEMNAYLREILCRYYSCDVAFDGIEGLQKVQTAKYSLIISDVMMPRLDGFELKQKINRLNNYKNTPFIFITAKAQLENRIEGYRLGVDDYIVKPFDKEELVARVSTLLTNKKVRDNWAKENPDLITEQGSSDELLLAKFKSIIRDNLSDESFKVSDLAEKAGYSPRQLSRIIKQSSGLTPLQFILEMRLQKAYVYLTEKRFATISEVRNKVGMPGAAHFNKKFYERFGLKPSDMMQKGY